MTTKENRSDVGGVVLVLGFLVVCFVGAIVGVRSVFGEQQRGGVASAKDFLRNNEKLKTDIGEVKDFGSIITGNVNFKLTTVARRRCT